jgi:integration host factor subunit beta
MTRSQLVEAMTAGHPDLSPEDSRLLVTLILEALSDSLAQGRRIEIRGFGSFGVNPRAPRTSRNPKTGDRVYVPGKVVPHFKAGKELRERVTTPAA